MNFKNLLFLIPFLDFTLSVSRYDVKNKKFGKSNNKLRNPLMKVQKPLRLDIESQVESLNDSNQTTFLTVKEEI